jgi:hypothetical protein
MERGNGAFLKIFVNRTVILSNTKCAKVGCGGITLKVGGILFKFGGIII